VNVLRTTYASVGEVVEPTSIRNLPLNGRMLIDLVLTVPGAHERHGAQTGNMSPLYWRPGQRSAVSIGGNRPNANYFLLDGATNTDPTFNTLNLSPSPDTVQEFKVQTGSYTAEMGGAGGGQINIVTRTGTNQFHGTGYDYVRNNFFDANSFFNNQQDLPVPVLKRNQFGGTVGGPILRNRLFFFFSYEGLRLRQPVTQQSAVPDAASRDWSGASSGLRRRPDIYHCRIMPPRRRTAQPPCERARPKGKGHDDLGAVDSADMAARVIAVAMSGTSADGVDVADVAALRAREARRWGGGTGWARTRAIKSRGSTGLMRKSLAPSSSARYRTVRSCCTVTKNSGTFSIPEMRRNERRNSRPSGGGI